MKYLSILILILKAQNAKNFFQRLKFINHINTKSNKFRIIGDI